MKTNEEILKRVYHERYAESLDEAWLGWEEELAWVMEAMERAKNLHKSHVSGWRMFTVRMTNNNNEPIAYTSSMKGVDEEEAKRLAVRNDWKYGVKSVDSVVFDACR